MSKIINSEAKLGSFCQSAIANERSIQEAIHEAIKALQDFLSDEDVKSIEDIFKEFNVIQNSRTFEDYEDIVNLHGGLIQLVDSLTVKCVTQLDEHETPNTKAKDVLNHDLKNDKMDNIPLLDYLKQLANNVTYSKRIGFMRDILNTANKKEILFSNVFTEERINKRYKKLTLYFHPDKSNSPDIPDALREEYKTLGTELCICILEFKKNLFKLEESSNNDPQTLHEEKANEFWKRAIDCRNAHKAQWDKLKLLKKESLINISSEELKIHSINYGTLAYEEYRAACKLADNNKQLKSQIKLRGYMALSLYISDKFMEAQLYALAAINFVIRNSNTTQQDLYEAKEIFDKVKSGNPSGSDNTKINTEIKPKNCSYNLSNAFAKTETLVNEFSLLEKKAIYRSINDDFEKISTELMLKADRKLVRCVANKEEILQAKLNAKKYKRRGILNMTYGGLSGIAMASSGISSVAEAVTVVAVGSAISASLVFTAGVGVIFLGLYSGYSSMKRGNELLEEPKTREALNDIMKKALLAYDKGDYQKFYEEVSKEYKSGSRLLKLMRRGDSIDHEGIINALINHGFRSNGIAYLLLLISEVLISGKIKIQGITTNDLKTQGYLVLNGVLNETLGTEARKLDDRIQNLRKESWKSPTTKYEKIISRFKDFIHIREYSRLAQEYKDDAKEMPFLSRLEEMRNIARINLTIGDILNNGPEEINRAKELIEKVWKSINSHHQYIRMVETRLEALEDLFWVITGESFLNGSELILL